MSTEIDRRIVEMQFDNKEFERNVNQSLSTLDKLKMALNFDGAKGLESLTKAANRMDLDNVVMQVNNVRESFSALQVAGYTVVQEITKYFLNFGKKLWDISFGQMKSGGMSRALKIEQANFQMRALAKNLDAVKKELITVDQLVDSIGDSIDRAVTGTAYGYDSAAAVAAQLMASGMTDADKMYTYLRGIAGAAAMTGRSFEDIGNIFTTIASNGKLMTMQLRQFSASGLNIAATLGQQLGKTEAQVTDMISHGKIGFEEFAQSMYDAFGESAGEADKTYSGVLSNVKAQLSRLGQRFAVPYIENMIPFLQRLKATIKQVSASLAPIADRFDKVFGRLTRWGSEVLKNLDITKYTAIFRGLENLAAGAIGLIKAFKDAFDTILPPKTVEQLREAAINFERFTEQILPTQQALEGFKGIFMLFLQPLRTASIILQLLNKYSRPILVAVIKIGYAISSVFSVLVPLMSNVVDFTDRLGILDAILNGISNGILIAAAILNYGIDNLSQAIVNFMNSEECEEMLDFFKELGLFILNFAAKAINYLIGRVIALKKWFATSGAESVLIKNFNAIKEAIQGIIDGFHEWISVKDSAAGFKSAIEMILNAFHAMKDFVMGKDISGDIDNVGVAFQSFVDAISDLCKKIKRGARDITAGKVLLYSFIIVLIALMSAIKSLTLHATIFINYWTTVPTIFKTIKNILIDVKRWIGPIMFIMAFSKMINTLTDSLLELSEIPFDNLKNAAIVLGGSAVAIAAIGAALMFLATSAAISLPAIEGLALLIFGFSLSILVLSKAFNVLYNSTYEWEHIGKSLLVLSGLLLELGAASVIFSKARIITISDTVGIMAFAAGVYILVLAFEKFMALEDELNKIGERMKEMSILMLSLGAALMLAGKMGGISAISILSFVGSLIIVFNLLNRLSEIPMADLEKTLEKANAIINTMVPLILTVGLANLLSKGTNVLGSTMWTLVLSLSGFILALSALSIVLKKNGNFYEVTKILESVINFMTFLMTAIMLATGVMTLLSQFFTANTGLASFAASEMLAMLAGVVYSFAAVIVAIGVAIRLMDGADTANFGWLMAFVGVIGLFALLLEGLTIKMKGFPNMAAELKQCILPFLMLTSLLVIAIGGLGVLAVASKEADIGTTAWALFIVLAGLAGLFAAFAAIKFDTMPNVSKTINVLWGFAAIATVIIAGMYLMKDVYGKDIITYGVTMTIMLAVIAGIVQMFAEIPQADYKDALFGILALFALLVALVPIGGVLYMLSNIETGNGMKVLKYMVLILAVVAILGAGIYALMRLTADQTFSAATILAMCSGLAIACLSFVEIAYAMTQVVDAMSGYTEKDLSGPFTALITMFGLIAVLLGVASVIGSKNVNFLLTLVTCAASLALAAGSFVILADAFCKIKEAGITANELGAMAVALGGLIAVITVLGGAISFVLSLMGPVGLGTLLAFAGVLLSLGLCVELLGDGMLKISKTIQDFLDISDEQLNATIDKVIAFVDRFSEIEEALSRQGTAMSTTIFNSILTTARMIGVGIGIAFASALEIIVGILDPLIVVILDALAVLIVDLGRFLGDPAVQQYIYDLCYALGQVCVDAFLAVIAGAIEAFGTRVSAWWSAFWDDIEKKEAAHNTAGRVGSTERYVSGNIDELDNISDRLQEYIDNDDETRMYQAAEMLIAGLSNAIRDGSMTVDEAWEYVMDKGFDTIIEKADIHSPSRVTYKYGVYMMEGLIYGVKSKNALFVKTLEDTCKEGLGVISKLGLETNKMLNDSVKKGGSMRKGNDIYTDRSLIVRPEHDVEEHIELQTESTNTTNEATQANYEYAESVEDIGVSADHTWGNIKESTDTFLNWVGESISNFTESTTGLTGGLGNIAAELLGIEGFKTSDEWREYGQEFMGGITSSEYYKLPENAQYQFQRWYQEGYKSLEDYVNSKSNVAEQFINKLFNFDDVTEDTQKKIEEIVNSLKGDMPDGLGELDDLAKKAAERLENLKNTVKGCLDIFSEFNTEVKMTGKDVLRNFMSQIEGVSDWTNMLNKLAERGLNAEIIGSLEEAGPQSFAKVSAIYSMTDRELAELNALYSDSLKLADESINSIEVSWSTMSKTLSLDDISEEAAQATESMASLDEETQAVLNRLTELQNGGNVNLLMRPSISTEDLNAVGYDAGEGFATVFSSTFSNEAEDMAVNFTPIIVDPKTGQYLGVMAPDEFDTYCQEVVDGVRTDDMNLQIGMAFNGEDAIEKAEAAAMEIHDLHEQLGDEWGKNGFQQVTIEATDGIEQAVESEEDDIRKVMANYGHSAIEALRAQFKFEDAINAVKAFRDELSETLKSSLKLFDDYEEDEEIKSDKLLWNMIENTKKVGRWATNMSKLAGRGLSEGLLAELKELGPEGSAKVEAFLRMTDDQLERANRAYESSTGLPDYAADKMASAYAKAGYYTSLGFAEGIDPEAAIAVMEQLATKSLTSLEEALDINSPSKKTYQDGVYAIQGFVLGLQDEESMTNLNDAILLLADAIDKDFTDTLTKSRFMTIAANCLSGLKQGFNKNIKMVVDSVNTVSNAVLNTFRSKLKINSPSEEFAWCAEMCNLGFAEGMSNDTSAVTATEQKADDIFTAMYDKMYAVGLGLGSNDIFNPVITPVLNMSDVQSGFKTIKDYIGAEKFSVNGTVNKAVITQNGLSKDAMVISASIDSMNARIEALSSRMSAIGSDIEQMRYAIADGVPLYLDTGAMVGQIAGPMDRELGSRVIRAKRGKG